MVALSCGGPRVTKPVSSASRKPAVEQQSRILSAGAIVILAAALAVALYREAGLGVGPSVLLGFVCLIVLMTCHAALEFVQRSRAFFAQPGITPDMPFANLVAAEAERAELAERLSRLEAHLQALANRPIAAEGPAQPGIAAKDLDVLRRRFDQIGGLLEAQIKSQNDRIGGDLKMLETLVKQLAEQVAIGHDELAELRALMEAYAAQPALAAAASEPQPAEAAKPKAPAKSPITALDAEQINPETMRALRRTLEAERFDLYLQPIVTLPQRKVRYYEALTRLRDTNGQTLMPQTYIGMAEVSGVMPLIDNLLLYRAVQVIRRLNERGSVRGLFCNISAHTLLDPEFFPEFVNFMDKNRDLKEHIFFEFSQAVVKSMGALELESLNALGELGFQFSMDRVTTLDYDFEKLRKRHFRFVKIEGRTLLTGMAEAKARIHAADMKNFLKRHGLELIVEKIEEENALLNLLDYGAELGQGYLFSEPRPVRPEILRVGEGEAA